MSDKKLRGIGFKNSSSVRKFVEKPDWENLFAKIEKFNNAIGWYKTSFESIRTGSKGLAESMYLDYALINVPPPVPLFGQLLLSLLSKKAVGYAAPTGWGKSRIMLWLALYLHLDGYDIYYFSDPLGINVSIQEAIVKLSQKKNKVFIFDDYHLRLQTPDFVKFIRELISQASYKKNIFLLFIQTKEENEKDVIWEMGIHVCSIDYTHLWEESWKKSFFDWFQSLRNTPLNDYLLKIDELKSPEWILSTWFDDPVYSKTSNPWSFVSIIVDLSDQIQKQLIQKNTMHKFLLLTIITWGYCISNEIGLTLNQIYTGFVWVKNNRPTFWNEILSTGGLMWDHVNNEDRNRFVEESIEIISEWQKPPKDYHNIRLLPLSIKSLGGAIPIVPFHKLWWQNSIKIHWDKNKLLDSWQGAKKACEYAIINCSSIINCRYLSDLNQLFECFERLINVHELKISYLKNLKIPETVGNLKNLKKLEIYSCYIVEIPESIGKLHLLEELSLGINDITEIPPSIGELKNLKKLDLSNNILKSLPITIANLRSLRILDLSVNNLKEVPSVIKNLRALQILKLNMCNINELPSFIGDLINLKLLDLGTNSLQSLPESIGNLSSLIELYLYENKIRSLPESIGNLNSLKRLWTGSNNIASLPNAFTRLNSLEEIDLGGNPIKQLPEDFNKLSSLEDLIICTRILDRKSLKIIESLETNGVLIEEGIKWSGKYKGKLQLKGMAEDEWFYF